mgnify:CR=1 FL=1
MRQCIEKIKLAIDFIKANLIALAYILFLIILLFHNTGGKFWR